MKKHNKTRHTTPRPPQVWFSLYFMVFEWLRFASRSIRQLAAWLFIFCIFCLRVFHIVDCVICCGCSLAFGNCFLAASSILFQPFMRVAMSWASSLSWFVVMRSLYTLLDFAQVFFKYFCFYFSTPRILPHIYWVPILGNIFQLSRRSRKGKSIAGMLRHSRIAQPRLCRHVLTSPPEPLRYTRGKFFQSYP